MNDQLKSVLRQVPKKAVNVFVNAKGKSLNDNRVREWLIKFAIEAGVENLTEVHSLRHTFASMLIKNGVDVPTVQKLMGHSLIETTMIYPHQTNEQMHNAVDRVGILGNEDASKIVKLEV